MWGLKSGLTTCAPSRTSSGTERFYSKTPMCLPLSSQSGPPLPAQAPTSLPSPVLPARRSLSGRAVEAEAPADHLPLRHPLGAQGAARSSRPPPTPPHPPLPTRLHGRYLSNSWSSSIAGAASGILRWCCWIGGSNPYRETCRRSRKEGTTDGRSRRRKEGGGAAAARHCPAAGRGVYVPPGGPAHRPRPRREEGGGEVRGAHLEFPELSLSAEPAGRGGVGLLSPLEAENRPWALGFSPRHLTPGDGEGGGALPVGPQITFLLRAESGL